MEEIIHGKPLLPRAISVETLPNYMLKIKFNNNEVKYFDVKKKDKRICSHLTMLTKKRRMLVLKRIRLLTKNWM